MPKNCIKMTVSKLTLYILKAVYVKFLFSDDSYYFNSEDGKQNTTILVFYELKKFLFFRCSSEVSKFTY